MDIKLPEVLESLRKKIEESVVEYIKITAAPEDHLTAYQSKYFGKPYLPQDTAYPLDPTGNPMVFIAQLNFSEIPQLSCYPENGILQFYIADDGSLGLEFDSHVKNFEQKRFRVLYFPEPFLTEERLKKDFPKPSMQPSIIDSTRDISEFEKIRQCKLTFEKQTMPVTLTDYHFNDYFNKEEINDEMLDAYHEALSSYRHQIGGYASFTQEDPRKYLAENIVIPDMVLFQMNADYKNTGFNWGDMGIANWFITKDDLIKLDFSKVLYNWDCS